MQRVINGKSYNTKTATKVHEVSFGYASDFGHFEEALFKTTKGAWSLAGEGGPMTRYATHLSDGSRSGGAGLMVLSEEEALAYLERNQAEPDVIAEHFEIEEG